jgi:hypothetical protein
LANELENKKRREEQRKISAQLRDLGSYYNSQHIAHVGYILVVTAFLFQLGFLFFNQIATLIQTFFLFFSGQPVEKPLTLSAPIALAICSLIVLSLALLYFVARTEMYSVYSQTVWDLQGINGRETRQAVFSAVDRNRASFSLSILVKVTLYVKLFASKEKWHHYLEITGTNYNFFKDKELREMKKLFRPKDWSLAKRKLFRVPLTFLLPVALVFHRENLGIESFWLGLEAFFPGISRRVEWLN